MNKRVYLFIYSQMYSLLYLPSEHAKQHAEGRQIYVSSSCEQPYTIDCHKQGEARKGKGIVCPLAMRAKHGSVGSLVSWCWQAVDFSL